MSVELSREYLKAVLKNKNEDDQTLNFLSDDSIDRRKRDTTGLAEAPQGHKNTASAWYS